MSHCRTCGRAEACGKKCEPLSSSEKEELRAFHTRLPKNTKCIDLGVRSMVSAFHEKGWGTVFSCDGHGIKPGYIAFYTREEAQEAMGYLQRNLVSQDPRRHCIIDTKPMGIIRVTRLYFKHLTPFSMLVRLTLEPTAHPADKEQIIAVTGGYMRNGVIHGNVDDGFILGQLRQHHAVQSLWTRTLTGVERCK